MKICCLSVSQTHLPFFQGLRVLTKVYVVISFFVVSSVFQDGTIDKNDLRGAFDNVGVLMTESELDELLGEVRKKQNSFFAQTIFLQVSGPCTYDNMVKLFQDKMAGGKFIFYSASDVTQTQEPICKIDC